MTAALCRLARAALVVLALPGSAAVPGRCAGQEPEARAAPGDARLVADRGATLRVLAVEVRGWLLSMQDPDAAYQLLKEALDAIREAPTLSTPCREGLEASLERAIRDVLERGIRIKQRQTEHLELRSEFRARLSAWQFEIRRAWARLGLLPGPE
jgi:hypothetical protein